MKKQQKKPSYLNAVSVRPVEEIMDAIEISTRRTSDGRRMFIYRVGDPASDCMVLLPPVGISFMLVVKLAMALSKNFHVMTWESMGCPDRDTVFMEDDLNLERQAAEFEYILDRENIPSFHFAGWCQAAQLIAQVVARAKAIPETVSLIAPAGLGCSVLRSEFDKCALPLYLQIEQKGIEYADKIGIILDKFGTQPITAANVAEKLSLIHMQTPEATYCYSKYVKSFQDNQKKVNRLLDSVIPQSNVLLVHCMDDNYSHYSESVQLAKKYPTVTLEVLQRGGHLLIFDTPEILANAITGFIEKCARESTAAAPAAVR